MLMPAQKQAPTRPALRWHGGKWLLAPWIISHFPEHRVYVEPFGGAASVLLRKPRSYAEVYNDLDRSVVSLFQVLRNQDTARDLIHSLTLTPFARAEFDLAYLPTDEPIEAARRLVVRSFMGHGSDAPNLARKGGFRANSNRSGTTPAHDWVNYPDALEAVVERLRGVIIENRDYQAVCRQHDSARTLHYLDPPYPMNTRSGHKTGSGNYAHEMSDSDHASLLQFVRELEGMVVLSGYANDLYDNALADWQRVEKASFADGARPRTEVLWINPQAAALGTAQFAFEAAE